MQTNPNATTALDICQAALRDAGVIGIGQTPLKEYLYEAQSRLQWMLQQWERKRWLVYHLLDMGIVSTGAISYSIGPGGNIDTGSARQFNQQFGGQFGSAPGQQNLPSSARPNRLEAAYLRQLNTGGNIAGANQIDYPLTLIESREDYTKISLKTLQSFPSYLFYDTAWPLGYIYPWPIPQPVIYEIHVVFREQLPAAFATANTVIALPYEYFEAMVLNLALRLRVTYTIPTFPGDPLPGRAAEALQVIRGANTQISRLSVPGDLLRPGLYNIFSDRFY